MNLPVDSRRRILAAASTLPSITRPRLRRIARAAYVVVGAMMAMVFFAIGGVEHARGRPIVFTALIAAGASAIAIASTSIAMSRGRSMLGRSTSVSLAVVVAVPIATFAWLSLWHDRYLEPFRRVGYRCLALTLMLGAAPLIVTMILRARSYVRSGKMAGSAIGVASGACAGVLVDLWCPLCEPRHVAFGHVLPMIVLSVAGAVAGGLALPMRFTPRVR